MPSHFVALLFLASLAQASGHEESPYHQTIERVLTLLPKRPAQVVIVDQRWEAGTDTVRPTGAVRDSVRM